MLPGATAPSALKDVDPVVLMRVAAEVRRRRRAHVLTKGGVEGTVAES